MGSEDNTTASIITSKYATPFNPGVSSRVSESRFEKIYTVYGLVPSNRKFQKKTNILIRIYLKTVFFCFPGKRIMFGKAGLILR